MYLYGQIALATARAITGHTRTSKSTDYCPNCTWKCVINYTNYNIRKHVINSTTIIIYLLSPVNFYC